MSNAILACHNQACLAGEFLEKIAIVEKIGTGTDLTYLD
jgi:hypothetical protein